MSLFKANYEKGGRYYWVYASCFAMETLGRSLMVSGQQILYFKKPNVRGPGGKKPKLLRVRIEVVRTRSEVRQLAAKWRRKRRWLRILEARSGKGASQ